MAKVYCLNCQRKLKHELFVAKEHYTFFICDRCGLMQIYPVPKMSKKERSYSYKSPLDHLSATNPQYNFVARLPFAKDVLSKVQNWVISTRRSRIEKLLKSGRLLDIGCSEAGFLASLDRSKWQLSGVEINKYAAKRAQEKLVHAKIHAEAIETIKLPKKSFDIITLWHVFEHLHNPKAVLEKIHTLLDSQGFVVIEVPNANALYRRVFGPNWQLLIVPQHLYFWSKKALTEFLQKSGFMAIEASYSGVISFSASSSIANVLRSKGLSSTIAILVAILVFPLTIMVNVFSSSLRENMLVIAKKK